MKKIFVFLIVAAAASIAIPAFAQDASVAQLYGTVSVKKADGTVRILSRHSQIGSGDTITTERDSYALVLFRDGAQVLLKPGTAVRLDTFRFSDSKPQDDLFTYSLLHGGLRAATGTIGKRSSSKYQLATATVGVSGKTFSVDDCVSERAADCARLDAAVYVAVADGDATVTNRQGVLDLSAGQVGLIAPDQRPLFLSTDPGLQFTPPATFIRSVMAGSVVNTGRNLECAISR
jgi:hypothetical protein